MAEFYTSTVEFEMTNYCNGNCIFCPRNDPRPKGFISIDTVRSGVELAKACNITGFKLAGFGEPTLDKDLVPMIKFIKEEIPTSKILLITNGSLLDKVLYQRLVDASLDRINISFNGFDKISYESQMRELDFDRLITNLIYIAKNISKTEIQFVPIRRKGFEDAEIGKMKNFLINLGFNECNLQYSLDFTNRSGKLEVEVSKEKCKAICMANFNTLFVSWTGDIHICCNDIYGEGVIGQISDIKTPLDLRNLEKKALNLRADYSMEVCRKCDIPSKRKHVEIKGFTYTTF